MRLARVLAGVVAATALAASESGARSDSSSSPPPTFNLWNRPGIWKTTTAKNAPFQIGDMAWGQADDGGEPTGVVSGAFNATFASGGARALNLIGATTGSGRAIRGTTGTPDVQGTTDKFAVKIVDTARYEQFKGTFWSGGTHGFQFSGTYQPGPVADETGSANLNFLLFATPSKHTLGSSKVTQVHGNKLPAKFAVVGVVQNTGPDLLPRGVAQMKFKVTPGESEDVTLPLIWKVSRVIDPFTYQVGDTFGDSWNDGATIGALGSKSDRAVFGFEVDVGAGFPAAIAINGKPASIQISMTVVSNASGFELATKDVKSGTDTATLTIPVLDD